MSTDSVRTDIGISQVQHSVSHQKDTSIPWRAELVTNHS